MVVLYSVILLLFSVSLMILSITYLVDTFQQSNLITGLIKSTNIAFIFVATFELGAGVLTEYNPRRDE